MTSSLDPAVRAAARVLKQWYGIEVADYRLPLLASELARIGGRGGPQAALDRLLAPDRDAWDAVIDAITVPETYLFRHVGHFELLQQLAEQRHREGRSCRVLSAGCSSGEEVWSAAAVLASTTPCRTSRDLVLGWDVNEHRLQMAREGRYRHWSVRAGLHAWDSYFYERADLWEVTEGLRAHTRFERVNLVGELPVREAPFDAVFFRNVGIYWEESTARGVVRALCRLLTEDGLLLIGPSDPGPTAADGWQHVIDAGIRYYRRGEAQVDRVAGRPRPQVASPHRAPLVPARRLKRIGSSIRPTRIRLRRARLGAELSRVASSPPPSRLHVHTRTAARSAAKPPEVAPEPEVIDRVRVLADSGRYQEALTALAEHADVDGIEARIWKGILLLNLEQAGNAVQAFRECVFLEPESASHRRWLAVAYESAGRMQDAERENRNAMELSGV